MQEPLCCLLLEGGGLEKAPLGSPATGAQPAWAQPQPPDPLLHLYPGHTSQGCSQQVTEHSEDLQDMGLLRQATLAPGLPRRPAAARDSSHLAPSSALLHRVQDASCLHCSPLLTLSWHLLLGRPGITQVVLDWV